MLKDNIQFTKSNYQQIFDEYATAVRNKNIPDDQYFINHHDENIAKLTIDLISTPYILSKNWEIKHKIFINTESHQLKHTVVTSVLSFKLRKIEQMIHKNELEIKAAVNHENILALLEKEKKLLEAKVLISSNLGRIITK